MKTWLALLALLFVAGCARPPLDPQADRAAREFYAAVHAGDWSRVDASLSPAMARGDRRAAFEQVRRALPPGPVREVRAVGWTRPDGADPASCGGAERASRVLGPAETDRRRATGRECESRGSANILESAGYGKKRRGANAARRTHPPECAIDKS